MGAFTSDVMSVEWHAGVSTVGASAAGFFHGSLRFTLRRMKHSAAVLFFHGSLHFACDVSGVSTAIQQLDFFHGGLHFTCGVYIIWNEGFPRRAFQQQDVSWEPSPHAQTCLQ